MSSRHVPIAAHRETLLWALENRSALVVVGETGCGKSTQLPKYLIEAGCGAASVRREHAAAGARGPRARDARRGRARLRRRRRARRAARFEERWCPERTRLKFTTDGWLLREALFDPLFAHYSVVVVDEAHERSLATDLLLGLLKKALRARAARGDALRVVVMSATADADAFERFFGVDDTAVAVVDGRQYAVDVFFADAPRGADYVAAAAEAVERAHASERRLEAAILVFLPGAREVEERPQEARAGAGTGKYRKVVVATNVAETSLTIPDVAVVIDPGLCRLPVFDEAAGAEVLATTVCSRASAVQRAGRAGRTGPGKCYRLYTEAAFASDLFPERTPPASSRSELSWALLQLKALGVDNVLEFDLLSPLPETLLLLALEELLALGARRRGWTAPRRRRSRRGAAPRAGPFSIPRRRAQRDAQNEKTRAFRDDLVSLDGDHATYGACLRRFLELRDARADPLPFCAARGLDLSALHGGARAAQARSGSRPSPSDGTALADLAAGGRTTTRK
ncbi:helicase [Aureococcus anophagefferens]|nr:helicase [Aureococcus anophagefferens]